MPHKASTVSKKPSAKGNAKKKPLTKSQVALNSLKKGVATTTRDVDQLSSTIKNSSEVVLNDTNNIKKTLEENMKLMRDQLTEFRRELVTSVPLPSFKNEIGTPGGNVLFDKILHDFSIIGPTESFTGFVFNDLGNHLLTPDVPRVEPSPHWTPPADPTYESVRRMHNRRFDFRPWVIVCPKSTEEVSWCVKLAKVLNRKIRIRAGAHDHAGESNATDALLIDCTALRESTYKKIDEKGGELTIGTGWKFIELFRKLGEQPDTKDIQLAFPHGTCQSVGVAGYLLGGGWGPYTRQHGMCCESLVAATVVLGDGTIVKLRDGPTANPADQQRNDDLLFALRGGGGPSYGVVTSMTIKCFSIASTHNYTFSVHWNAPDIKPTEPHAKTLNVVKRWQNLLVEDTPGLTGTNLQITAKYVEKPDFNDPAQGKDSELECQFYGYLQSVTPYDDDSFAVLVNSWFPDAPPCDIELHRIDGMVTQLFSTQLFSNWARQGRNCKRGHLADAKRRLAESLKNMDNKFTMLKNPATGGDEWPIQVEYLLEEDRPDPHMITSRMAKEPTGLTDEQFEFFIHTLHSELLPTPEDHAAATKDPVMGRNPVATYCNFNGIAGPFYRNPAKLEESKKRCSFPYQNSCYVIQYQAWWEASAVDNQRLHNRAMDWIQINSHRKWECGGVEGSFISFKNSEIPEEDYFQGNYNRLIDIKKKWSKDPTNILRSRRSII